MHDSGFIGCIRVSPPLNDDEVAFLRDLAGSGRTLRSTPTGRGNTDVPFARMAWEACDEGCCLSWDDDRETTEWMQPSLTFLIDHLFRAGAEGEGRHQFEGFAFDHVLRGMVVGRGIRDAGTTLVEVTENVVTERPVPAPCSEKQPSPASGTKKGPPSTRAVPRASNVIERRPRRAT